MCIVEGTLWLLGSSLLFAKIQKLSVEMAIHSFGKYLVIYNMSSTRDKMANKNKTASVLRVFLLWSGKWALIK